MPDQPASRREREREQRRQTILDAAEQIFAAAGYQNAGMAAIAAQAAFSVGTLYYFFPSKQGLFAEVALRNLERSLKAIRAHVASANDWQGQLDGYIRHYLSWGCGYLLDILRTFEEVFNPAEHASDDSLARFLGLRQEALQILTGIAARAGNPNPDFLALVVMGTLNSLCNQARLGLLTQPAETYAADIIGLVRPGRAI